MSVSQLEQIPRAAMLWLMLALIALLIPHAMRIPLWTSALFVCLALWRYLVFRGFVSAVSRYIKLPLAALVFSGVYLSYGTLLGLEPTVALLMAALALKLLESAAQKDGYLLVFLGYFVCITVFLFSQSLPMVLYLLIPISLLTTALLALHIPEQQHLSVTSYRFAWGMLLQAVPLMLVLFFLFPRIDPLWQVPLKRGNAVTGVSDRMQPGDISRLSQSAEVAFRVTFEEQIPPRQQLYWRGPVLSGFSDGAWLTVDTVNRPLNERYAKPYKLEGEALNYTVIVEPGGQQWLYALRRPDSSDVGIRRLPEDQLVASFPLFDRYTYTMRSYPDAPMNEPLSTWRRELELALPAGENPAMVAMAKRLWAQTGDAQSYVQAVLDHFRSEPFYYTLEPPPLSKRNPMDDFLFRSRRGFCEHYAYAFVVLMRAAGVPARVVAGYQGGEVNPVNGSVIVRQFDAHAWAEVWMGSARGWQRVDPTAAVAPARIESGLQDAAAQEFLSDSPMSPLHFTNIRWLNSLRLQYDALVYRWQRFILGYDASAQFDFLQRALGGVDVRRFVALLMAVAVLVMLPLIWFLLRHRKPAPLSPEDKQLRRLQNKLAAAQLHRNTGEAVAHWGERVAKAEPAIAGDMRQFVNLYEALSYRRRSDQHPHYLRQLRACVRRIRVH